MSGQPVLRPADVGVAVSLVEYPRASYDQLHDVLGISRSNAHAAVRRLRLAGLVRQDERVVVRSNLLEFLVHGVRYTFPGLLGASAKGVATSHAGPILSHDIVAEDAVVWPSAKGSVVGPSLPPLVPKAAELPERSPNVYALMTLVDALRVGRIRERRLAAERLWARVYDTQARPRA
jgi:hypothetical protein